MQDEEHVHAHSNQPEHSRSPATGSSLLIILLRHKRRRVPGRAVVTERARSELCRSTYDGRNSEGVIGRGRRQGPLQPLSPFPHLIGGLFATADALHHDRQEQ